MFPGANFRKSAYPFAGECTVQVLIIRYIPWIYGSTVATVALAADAEDTVQ